MSNTELRNKIKKGLDLSYKRLVKSKSLSNGILVLSDNGRIKKVRAVDLLKQ
jgi:uncharacterized protein YwbE